MKLLQEYKEKFAVKNPEEVVLCDLDLTDCDIPFANGWAASVVNASWEGAKGKYSIMMCDFEGNFDSKILNEYGANNSQFFCNTEEGIIKICDIIRNLPNNY